MDGERSASENLAKLKKKKIRQNLASPKPGLCEYSSGPALATGGVESGQNLGC